MGCGPIVDPEICRDRTIIITSITFFILTVILICMIYWDKIITMLK